MQRSGGVPYDDDLLVDITPRTPAEAVPDPAPRWLGPLLILGVPTAAVAVLSEVLWHLLTAAP